jgi:hypothetical protein
MANVMVNSDAKTAMLVIGAGYGRMAVQAEKHEGR